MGWLARAAAATALRSEEPRSRFARWTARWLPPTSTVPGSQFQAADEPYPRHWRRFPDRWPLGKLASRELQAAVIAAVEELPVTWRAVVVARDAQGRDAVEVSEALGLTLREQRAILNKARARVRHRIAARLTAESDR